MSIFKQQWFRRVTLAAVREEDGQIIPWVLFMMFFFLGMCALSIDVGHAMLVQRQLQASTDAAALAAAQHLNNPDSSDWQSYALSYSAAQGSYNQYTEYGTATPSIVGYCSTTVAAWWGASCPTVGVNAIKVYEETTVPMAFTQYIGISSIRVSAMATASKGSKPLPFNVAILLDTTPSMKYTDSSCGGISQLQCASNGIQKLLKGLAPSVDSVSIFTFPNVTSSDASKSWCDASQSAQTDGPYTFPVSPTLPTDTNPIPPGLSNVGLTTGSGSSKKTTYYTYQIAGFANDFLSSDSSTTLSNSSQLSNVVGVGSGGCNALKASTDMNTYFAAAIYAAQSALILKQYQREGSGDKGTQNAMIILSDGDATASNTRNYSINGTSYTGDMVTSGTSNSNGATSSGTYPSWNNQCQQAVTAAKSASDQGTIVFTIAYGANAKSGCSSDGGKITPCNTMRNMATGYTSGDTTRFYSDYSGPSGDSACQGAANKGVDDLDSIFNAIRGQLSAARLIPNGTA